MGKGAYAVWIASVASLAGLLFGYDTAVISGAIAYLPQYFDLSPAGVGWAVSSALVGCVVGAAASGRIGNRFGRRRTLIVAAVCYTASAVGSALAWDFTSFWLFRILGGIGIGLSAVVPLYISEIAPPDRRGRLASLYQLAITFGILVVYFANWRIAASGDQAWNLTAGWRWMLGSETVPALLFCVLLAFLPESPRWLVMRRREPEARAVLARVLPDARVDAALVEIRDALADERKRHAVDVWAPANRRFLIYGCLVMFLQQAVGINVIIYYGAKLMSDVGIGGEDGAFFQTVLIGIVNFGGTFIGIALVDRWGRKPLMMVGTLGTTASIMTVGLALLTGREGAWLLPVILIYIVFFASTLGPIAIFWASEFAPSAARAKVVSLAFLSLWLANILVSQTFPMINDNAFNRSEFNGAVPFFAYGGFAFLFFLLVWRVLPETKDRSLEEISRQARSETA